MSAPLTSLVPSSVFTMMCELGSPSSDTVFPARHTQKSSGRPAERARSSRTRSRKSASEDSGNKSCEKEGAFVYCPSME